MRANDEHFQAAWERRKGVQFQEHVGTSALDSLPHTSLSAVLYLVAPYSIHGNSPAHNEEGIHRLTPRDGPGDGSCG